MKTWTPAQVRANLLALAFAGAVSAEPKALERMLQKVLRAQRRRKEADK